MKNTVGNRYSCCVLTLAEQRRNGDLGEAEIVELTFLIGYINMLNWFNNALQVEYRGELAESEG